MTEPNPRCTCGHTQWAHNAGFVSRCSACDCDAFIAADVAADLSVGSSTEARKDSSDE